MYFLSQNSFDATHEKWRGRTSWLLFWVWVLLVSHFLECFIKWILLASLFEARFTVSYPCLSLFGLWNCWFWINTTLVTEWNNKKIYYMIITTVVDHSISRKVICVHFVTNVTIFIKSPIYKQIVHTFILKSFFNQYDS